MSGIREATVSCYSFLKEATVGITQRVYRTMATPGDETVKKKQSETEKAGQSGGPSDGRMILVEELQATVEALVQKALESAGTQPKAPSGDDGKPHELRFQVESLPRILILGDDQGAPRG